MRPTRPQEEKKMATQVVSAGYGVWNKTLNVTSQIQNAYANQGERNFTADNRFGDPAPGQRKYLYIFWSDGTNTASGVVGENDATGINVP
jgi:hypothetical protein